MSSKSKSLPRQHVAIKKKIRLRIALVAVAAQYATTNKKQKPANVLLALVKTAMTIANRDLEVVVAEIAVEAVVKTTIVKIAKQTAKKPSLVQGVTLVRMIGKTRSQIPQIVTNVVGVRVVAVANDLSDKLRNRNRLMTISSMKI